MKHKNIKTWISRLAVAAMVVSTLLPFGDAYAAQITNRTVTLGSSAASAVTTHQISFTVPTGASIGSIGFQYCVAATGGCTMPTGLVTTGATLTAQSGATTFSVVNTTNGSPYITRTAATIAGNTPLSYTLGNITNPSTTNTTFYVRITTYTGTNGSTGPTDAGVAAASTANQITVTASVPETLSFCVYTGVNCAAALNPVALGTLSSASASSGTSFFDAGTNASGGYNVTLNGSTLTSGSNTIPAYTAGTSSPGTSGFGINLRANTAPSVGADVSTGTSPAIGTYATGYGTVNTFNFNTGDTIAQSSGPTNTNKFTVSYVANIGTAQAAGSYTTTLTYICTATF